MRTIEVTVKQPHRGQLQLMDQASRFNVIQCGRRFGKTTLGEIIATQEALRGRVVGWFAPTSKYYAEPMRSIASRLQPLRERYSIVENRYQWLTGGQIDYWSLVDIDSGRGRKYHTVIIDEASVVRDLQRVWTETIRPTLTDMRGTAWFLGTPRGTKRYFQTLFSRGEQKEGKWRSWRKATVDNDLIDPSEVAEAEREYESMGLRNVFEQEYLGIPSDDGGNPFGLHAIRSCVRDGLSDKDPVVFGVDLAKSHDWTVIVGLDDHGRVCRLERFQTDWGQTRNRILATVNGWPALIDQTGVGDPIVEDLRRVRPNIHGFVFTSMSKQQLMMGLASSIQMSQVLFPDGWLLNELESFEYEYRGDGGVRYQAPSGLHDDGVCALALAVKCFKDLRKYSLDVRVIGGERSVYDDDAMWH